jgi:hypothetical protein
MPLNSSQWATAVQAIFVVMALLVAAASLRVAVATLESDSRDRRVDRVIALHEELMSGTTGGGRSRLARLLRSRGSAGVCLQVSRDQLRGNTDVSAYDEASDKASGSPAHDLTLLLRFFERADIARTAGTLDELLLVALVGRHAGWWDLAIARDDNTARIPLQRLAGWCQQYVDEHPDEEILAGWGRMRALDFPSGPVQASDLPARPASITTS